MNSSRSQPPKISVVDGRARLRAAEFRPSGVSAGSAGELWLNKYHHPALVSYFGNDPNYFSAESLEIAMMMKDARLN